MQKELIFATNNANKAKEVQHLVGSAYKILDLTAIGCEVDIPETGNTFAENATLKSRYVVDHYHIDCFADDSGLEVEALDNEPGIYSARYSGQRGDVINMNFLLEKMRNVTNRNARFKTVISLIQDQQDYLFEGVIEGVLLNEPRGTQGFGYDPIFLPNGYDLTFAEMDLALKNKISHRALAMRKLIAFLQNG